MQDTGHTEKDEMLDIAGAAESGVRSKRRESITALLGLIKKAIAICHGATAKKVPSMSRHASLGTLMIYYRETDWIDDPAKEYISYE